MGAKPHSHKVFQGCQQYLIIACCLFARLLLAIGLFAGHYWAVGPVLVFDFVGIFVAYLQCNVNGRGDGIISYVK